MDKVNAQLWAHEEDKHWEEARELGWIIKVNAQLRAREEDQQWEEARELAG